MANKALKICIIVCCMCFISIILCNLNFCKLNIDDPRWQWIREKIFFDKSKTIDIAIIGSSYSWCGIKPKLISNELNGLNVYNLGRNWHGRDVDYFIIKHLAENHHIKQILLEFRDEENQNPHQFTKYLIEPDDIVQEMYYIIRSLKYLDILSLSNNFKKNISYIIDCMSNLAIRGFEKLCVRSFQKYFMKNNILNEKQRKLYEKENGYYSHGDHQVQNKKFLKKFANVKVKTISKKKYQESDYIPGTRADFYLKKICNLTQKKKIKLSFVYLPTYKKRVLPSQESFEYYSKLGEVLLPNCNDIFKINYWRDKNHLYKDGSVKFTNELISLLIEGTNNSPHYLSYSTTNEKLYSNKYLN